MSWLHRKLIYLVLAAVLIAAWFAPAEHDNGIALTERARASERGAPHAGAVSSSTIPRSTNKTTTVVAASRVEVLELQDRDGVGSDNTGDALFSATQWTVPPAAPATPPVVALAEPPPVAEAPPLPFRVLGRYEEEGRVTVFLQRDDQNLVVRVGDTIGETYKVESVAGSVLTLRYLPLNQVQMLDIAGML